MDPFFGNEWHSNFLKKGSTRKFSIPKIENTIHILNKTQLKTHTSIYSQLQITRDIPSDKQLFW